MITNWQKILLINYGAIECSKIAKVLNTSEKVIKEEAVRLGIEKISFCQEIVSKGFVTIIRNNYNLMTNDDICVLLDMDIKYFNKLLKEYDFLDVKLGKKPFLSEYHYRPLTQEEEIETTKIRKLLSTIIKPRTSQPFDFFHKCIKPLYEKTDNDIIKETFTAPYAFDYLNLLDHPLDENYLDLLRQTGTTGIWISGSFKQFSPFTFDLQYSDKYEENIIKLNTFIDRCKTHGIDVYLYLNEPRSLSDEFFIKNEDLRGNKAYDGSYVFCLAKEKVINYIYESTKYLVSNLNNLKGIMTITMSENPTHCFYRNDAVKCENCPFKNIYDVPVLINNTMAKAIKDANSKTTLIANLWGWAKYLGFRTKDTMDGIRSLDKEVAIMCVSEFSKEFIRNHKHNSVIDYSISVVGPSEISKRILNLSKELGHKTYAKIQINNSWECSAVPYIPAFNLMEKHIRNIKKLKVDGLMVGWSLGGYPGGFLPLANSIFRQESFDVQNYYHQIYEENTQEAIKAINIFSDAFKYYPFDVSILYLAPHTLGPANLWYIDKENRQSTMVCYSYNDINDYTRTYGIEGYLTLMNKLLNKWQRGIDVLANKNGNECFEELKTFSKAVFIHLKSAYNTVNFYNELNKNNQNKDTIIGLIDNELKITKELYDLVLFDSRIGFEMTNHYYYSENSLLLKIINLIDIKNRLT